MVHAARDNRVVFYEVSKNKGVDIGLVTHIIAYRLSDSNEGFGVETPGRGVYRVAIDQSCVAPALGEFALG